ncbi:hypothetical protein Sjap_007251 [Stephania japonica]|uniref:Uncharacterized protein n=1 Tax=Stephania japonica TaxID=461633 RepID=A0AAP0PA91_9MAGN
MYCTTTSDGASAEDEEEAEHRDESEGLEGGDEAPHHTVHDREVDLRPPERGEVPEIEPRPPEHRDRHREIEFRPPEHLRSPAPPHPSCFVLSLSRRLELSLSLSLSKTLALSLTRSLLQQL